MQTVFSLPVERRCNWVPFCTPRIFRRRAYLKRSLRKHDTFMKVLALSFTLQTRFDVKFVGERGGAVASRGEEVDAETHRD
jgi:hypothetical protein